MSEIKTMDGWNNSNKDFSEFVSPGDYVDEEIADWFLNCVPPASFEHGYIQCGEPLNHKNDPRNSRFRPVFPTFTKVSKNKWRYCGNCFLGDIEEPQIIESKLREENNK